MTIAAALATSCGRYDCGHVGRSDNQALKRAAFLFLAEQAGVTGVRTANEPAGTLAALALMRAGEACDTVAEVVRERNPETGRTTQRTVRTPTPHAEGRVTTGQAAVLRLIREGYDIPEIAERLTLATATVRSHLGYASRNLRTHSALDAAVEATRLNLL